MLLLVVSWDTLMIVDDRHLKVELTCCRYSLLCKLLKILGGRGFGYQQVAARGPAKGGEPAMKVQELRL